MRTCTGTKGARVEEAVTQEGRARGWVAGVEAAVAKAAHSDEVAVATPTLIT